MRRFILPYPLPDAAQQITLDGELFRHMVIVLRLKPGDTVILAEPSGVTCDATITAIGIGEVTLLLGSRGSSGTVSPLPMVLLQGVPKGDKLELIIQKATELGVTRIVPFLADRSVVKIPADRLPKRLARWQTIASEAARQSGGGVPDLHYAANLAEALATCNADLRLLPWEHEQAIHLKPLLETLSPPASVAIIIGPEGGFSPAELSIATHHGFRTVSLGPRILRTETAGFTLVAILQQAWGDIG